MLSQNNKLLVLGDSNVGMLKDLWDIDRNILRYENVSFWYHTGSAFNTIKVIQHYLRHPDGYRLARTDMA